MVLKNKLFLQLMRFGIVGVTAAVVHFSSVIFFVQIALLKPLVANIVAFPIAFQVSYWGHRQWTFNGTTALHSLAIPRLLLTSITGLIVNESLFYVFLVICNLPYPLALFIVLSTLPILTFIVNKFWVFR